MHGSITPEWHLQWDICESNQYGYYAMTIHVYDAMQTIK